ncbi:vacuolar protein sorting-associated protein 13C isoform X2 [Xenopus laevis]|uniref:Vacuolar protein sorting-associated protein 13C isoform X2 n=1 Tax=Xenopus laevis TaxID=8355 RepID=A0A8J0URT2_XENLA|nr:vacuolar protein sorting-associated protein 13C isoform X2 [Xenopus laevis]
MLESVVADLLNRCLGDYVENLDRSQLKLGIWGGNVVLENLRIKENALSELNVPFKVKAGQIDKLTLKIPWKNLYGDAVVATLEGLFLLVVPVASIKYDAQKEEKSLQDTKQRELQRIEDALQKAAAKDKPKDDKKDTFVEKLLTQVIKNLQIKITDIHIRYEDDITDVKMPFSVGVTLSELSLLTCNESWKPCILNEATKIIYKLVRLDSFSTYWNVKSKLYYLKSREDIITALKEEILSETRKPKDYQYIFKPVNASAKLCINPLAEIQQTTPKIEWNMEVQNVAVEVTKPQYLSLMDLLESVDYMVRNIPYRKYRPALSLQEDTKRWWLYAINSILEVHIRRRTQMWSWNNIAKHRQNLKAYKNAYKIKLTQPKLPEETVKQLQAYEKMLDVFNIVLARQQAQAEVIRSGQKLFAKKSSPSGEKKSGGWFGNLLSRKEATKKDDADDLSVPEQIDNFMGTEEKAKLFTAIGYSDSSHNLFVPKTYVAHVLNFKLLRTSITVREDIDTPETLQIQIIDLSTEVSQRPGAQAIKIEAKLEHWYVTGLRQQNIVPSLVTSIGNKESSLLKIVFETNPEHLNADQVLILQSQPVEIIYDAVTINALAEFFQTQKGMDLEQLTSATLMKLEEIKEKTATGLSHIIETRKRLDVRINLQPSYLVIPKSGFYHEKSDLVIIDLGSLQVMSVDQAEETTNFLSLEDIMEKAYDKFDVQIKNVQILFGKEGEDWKKAREKASSSLHILQPLDIELKLAKAMVERDSRMPSFKVLGELPLLHIKISDKKIQGMFELVNSIPLPQKSSTPTTADKKIPSIAILSRRSEKLLNKDIKQSLFQKDDSDSDEEFFDVCDNFPATVKIKQTKKPILVSSEESNTEETNVEELTDLNLKFEVKEVKLEFTKQTDKLQETILVFNIQQLGTESCIKTYTLTSVSYLKKISLDYYDASGLRKQPLHLISSSDKNASELLKVEYVKADTKGPHFQTTFENTEQTLKVFFSAVDLLLHSEALLTTISFLTESIPNLPDKSEKIRAPKQQDKESLVKKAAKVCKDKDVFAFKLFAKLDAFNVNVWDEKNHIAEIKIQGLACHFYIQSNQIELFARLKDIIVNDVNPHTIHKKAVSIMEEEEVFNFILMLYPEATQGDAYKDVSKVDGKLDLRVGCIQIVFLHKFLMSLLRFLNNFQAAKEKVSMATAQAAQRAATSVKDLAERSFRLLMDIHLKAPLIVVPQSSVSRNAIVADLGLLKISNQFTLVSSEDEQLPPFVDRMTINLTEFKLSRTILQDVSCQPDVQILHPINLNLSINRNLAATWYHKIPVVEVNGHLNSMNVGLSQEDVSVLLNVLVENLGEAEEEGKGIELSYEQKETTEQSLLEIPKSPQRILEDSKEDKDEKSLALNLVLHFEIQEVVVRLWRQANRGGLPLHVLHVSQLGAETRVGSQLMTASVYLKKISMTCNDFMGPSGGPLLLINSSDNDTAHLLKMEYVKADQNGPSFKTIHDNTEQSINILISSLDFILHTQALLSLMNFVSSAIPSHNILEENRPKVSKVKESKLKSIIARPESYNSDAEDFFSLKVSAKLNALNIFVCDEICNIADIRIQGMDASVAIQTKQTEVCARLEDIVIFDVDPKTIHKKAVYIMGDEVFNFKMSLYPEATEGIYYSDMSAVDGKICLKVGCIHIVYLHRFLMSLLNFLDKFQAAKEALSSATAQAAEKAASSMKEFAQKSFRLSMDIDLKAPVIIIPQSSVSTNAIIADLGFIRIQNTFSLVPVVDCPLPPVIDQINIRLTKLQLSRTVLTNGTVNPELEILQPVDLLVSVQRNLASTWYSEIPAMRFVGDLKHMQIALSQEDLTILMSVLFENLAETPSLPRVVDTDKSTEQVKKEVTECQSYQQKDTMNAEDSLGQVAAEELSVTLMNYTFKFESLSIVLYNSDRCNETPLWLHSESLRLGELRLHLLTSSGNMYADGSMDFSVYLKACTLDDLREGITKATSRMIDQKDGFCERNMVDISFKQSPQDYSITTILEKLYVCASVEFLMTVADFFVQAMPQDPSGEKSMQSHVKRSTQTKPRAESEESYPQHQKKANVKVVIMEPEIVFVANLMKADAPALTVSFQGNFTLESKSGSQKVGAVVKEFKVLACPFLRELRGSNITTVMQPCSLHLEGTTDPAGAQDFALGLEQVIIKVSPIILNTVQTIIDALKPKPKEDEVTENLTERVNIWDVRPIDSCSNWFLGVDMAQEISETFQSSEHKEKRESFELEVKSVQITLECGLGHRTVPLLLMESTFSAKVKNWTSFINIAADTTLEVHYYNENYAVWEPLIERVNCGSRRWSLKFEMKNNPVMDKSMFPGDDFILIPEPRSAINIYSKDTMNITISKCTLTVFGHLAKAFSEGTASTYDYDSKDRAPLTIKNALGVSIIVEHGKYMRRNTPSPHSSTHEVNEGQSLELEFFDKEKQNCGQLSAVHRQDSSLLTVGIVPCGFTQMSNIPVTKTARRLYNVRSPQQENFVSVLVQIDATEGNKVITIRSPLQIKNHFSIPFTVYKFVTSAKLLEPIGVVRPDEEFHVPLDSYRCQLFLRPAGALEGQFKESTSYITWKELVHRSSEVRCTLQCPASEISFLPLMVNCTAVPDEINFISSNGEKEWDPAYIIHLFPTLTVRNLVPYTLRFLLESAAETYELTEGSSSDVLQSRISGEIMELFLIKYQGRDWNGHLRVHEGLPEFFSVLFTADSSERLTVDLNVHVKHIGNRMVLSVYSPYWIINKTSRILQYKAEDIHVKHPSDYRDVILFSFKKKNIFSKNKVQLCISTSSWSNGFSLDTVGSYGCVKCPAVKMQYLIGVNIQMSSFNLSRIVTLTPFYTIVNKSKLEIEVGEIVTDVSPTDIKWNYVSSSECIPFWPENVSGKLCVRVIGCEGISKPFFFNKQDNGTLLSLESMNSGIIVDVSIADHSIVITFSDYYEGAAPALIINYTPNAKLTYMQSGTESEKELDSGEARLFAWADPTGIKKLKWKCASTTGEVDLLKDESGQFAYNQNIQIHWVSFLDGRQRVLLFTEDVAVVTKARQAEEMEQSDQEVTVSIHSLGLSLINNNSQQEISYIGIISSGVIWEMKRKQKWQPFNQKQILQLEDAYEKYLTNQKQEWVQIENNFKVNFSKVPMEMDVPIKCSIRRNFMSGIYMEFKQSPHQRSLRAQLYWLQVDNHLPGSMFPVVFNPVIPPKSVALDSEPKPFIDVSIITRFNEFSKVMQFKYFMVLIQCMALKLDQDFLAAVIGLFTPETDPNAERQRTQLIQKDLDSLNTELLESSMTDISFPSFFEHFHISPLKLHLSLSLGAGGEQSNKEEKEIIAISSVNLLLKSIGATLTDVDDLIFKLACFELKYQFYKQNQLMKLVVRHYTEQFLKQVYVLVLGLDVLGNPFGLIRGLTEGVEAFFYEPFQGAVQGPEEFAEGLVIGMKSLLGHTVGGAAGMVSRITGTVGKGLAAITMDKDYQQKRRQEMGRQPKDFGASLAKGGKGFLQGVVGGVTGIITKPVEGAKKDGAAGFFKGIGKGLVGVVARPTGGIVDMASSTFQGIQKVAESTEEVSPLRPPRLIHEDGIIRPYNGSEAQGFKLFQNLNIKKLDGEMYKYSCSLQNNKKANLMVTNRRVICLKEVEILGHRIIDWCFTFEEFVQPPKTAENILKLFVKNQVLFQKKENADEESTKIVPLHNNSTAEAVLKAIDEACSRRRQNTLVRTKSERFIKELSS